MWKEERQYWGLPLSLCTRVYVCVFSSANLRAWHYHNLFTAASALSQGAAILFTHLSEAKAPCRPNDDKQPLHTHHLLQCEDFTPQAPSPPSTLVFEVRKSTMLQPYPPQPPVLTRVVVPTPHRHATHKARAQVHPLRVHWSRDNIKNKTSQSPFVFLSASLFPSLYVFFFHVI